MIVSHVGGYHRCSHAHTRSIRLLHASLTDRLCFTTACSCNLAITRRSVPLLPSGHVCKALENNPKELLNTRHFHRGSVPQIRCASPGLTGQRTERLCPICSGTTQVRCHACKGSGRLTKSGYHARNPVNTAKIVGDCKHQAE